MFISSRLVVRLQSTQTDKILFNHVVQSLGPKLMENRKPFQLKEVLIVYNLIQCILSLWIFYGLAAVAWLTGYSYRCQPVDYSRSPEALEVREQILSK